MRKNYNLGLSSFCWIIVSYHVAINGFVVEGGNITTILKQITNGFFTTGTENHLNNPNHLQRTSYVRHVLPVSTKIIDGSIQHERDLQVSPALAYWSTTSLGLTNLSASIGNPLKGLTPNPLWNDPLSYKASGIPNSMEFYYIGLNSVMIGENKFNWTSLELLLNSTASRKSHAAVRFFIHYVHNPPLRIPSYLLDAGVALVTINNGTDISPDYRDPLLQRALQQFVGAFGAKYDGDKRIGTVQMGLLGFWGEWHTYGYPELLPDSLKQSVITWFKDAFKYTPIQTRYPSLAAKAVGGIGYYDDSFTYATLSGTANGGTSASWFFWPSVQSVGVEDFWKFSPMAGETRPENQDIVFHPDYPARTSYHQSFLECLHITHATWMHHNHGFSRSTFYSGTTLRNALHAHSVMGYNYRVNQVAAMNGTRNTTSSVTNGVVTIRVIIEQIGIAPFYFPLGIVLNCTGLFRPIIVTGVETIVQQFETKSFLFENVPATLVCLSSITLSLQSNMTYSDRPVKFAQGNGSIKVPSIPLPVILTPSRAPVSVRSDTPVFSSPPLLFLLYNAQTDRFMRTIQSGDTINQTLLGTNQLSIVVESTSTQSITRVLFTWTENGFNVLTKDERMAPFALAGNSGLDFFPLKYLEYPGSKTIKATAYSSAEKIFTIQTIVFSVV